MSSYLPIFLLHKPMKLLVEKLWQILIPSPKELIIVGIPIVITALSIAIFPKPVGGRDLSSWYLFLVLTFLTSIIPAMWVETAILTKRTGLESVPIIAAITWKARRGILLFAAIGASLGFVIYYFWHYGYLLFPQYGLHFYFILYIGVILRLFQPPVAVVLTAARSHTLVETVGRTLFPHRTVAMLNEKKFLGAMFLSEETDNLYAFPTVDWRKMVRRLVDIVPVVIVDARIPGESLKYETGLMLDPKRVNKAIFVVGVQGEKPALEINQHKIGNSKLLLVMEHELPVVLSEFKQTGHIRDAVSKTRMNPFGYWIDVGLLSNSHINDFRLQADRILRLLGLKGTLANLFLTEPSPGVWGNKEPDLNQTIMEKLIQQLDSHPEFIITPTGLQQTQSQSYPEIKEALQSNKIKFLIGKTPDNRRQVALLLLKEVKEIKIEPKPITTQSVDSPMTPESRHEAVRPTSWVVRIVVASIVSIIGYYATASYFVAIGLAAIILVYFGNIIALFLPKYSTKDELISTFATIVTVDIVYIMTLFIRPIREFIAHQGILIVYGIPIILSTLTLLGLIRGIQLRNE